MLASAAVTPTLHGAKAEQFISSMLINVASQNVQHMNTCIEAIASPPFSMLILGVHSSFLQ